jgi:hypothetical protein
MTIKEQYRRLLESMCRSHGTTKTMKASTPEVAMQLAILEEKDQHRLYLIAQIATNWTPELLREINDLVHGY